MSFQLALVVPRYCPVTDAYLGAKPMILPEFGALETRGWALERARYLAPFVGTKETPLVVIDEKGQEVYSDYGLRLPEVPGLPLPQDAFLEDLLF